MSNTTFPLRLNIIQDFYNDKEIILFCIEKCIVYQKIKSDITSSTENDRKRLRNASEIRQDDVYERLKMINENENFVCYK